MKRIEYFNQLTKDRKQENYLLVYFAFFVILVSWSSAIVFSLVALIYPEYNEDFVLSSIFIFIISMFTIANVILSYKHEEIISKLLNIKKVINNYDSVATLIRRVSALYSMPMPDIYVVQSENINIGSFYLNRKHSIVFNNSILDRLSDDELEFFISCEFAKVSNGYIRKRTAILKSMIFVFLALSYSRKLTFENNILKRFFGYIFKLLLLPCFSLRHIITKDKEINIDKVIQEASMVTGIPLDINYTINSINSSNNKSKLNDYDLIFDPFFTNNTSSYTSLNGDIIDMFVSYASDKEIDMGIINNRNYILDMDIVSELSTVKGCISIYYSMLLNSSQPPANLYYKNPLRKIYFPEFMLPFIVFSIKEKLKGAIKDKTADHMKKDLDMMLLYTNKFNVAYLIACNDIASYLDKCDFTEYRYYGVSRMIKNVLEDDIDDLEGLISSIRSIKHSKFVKESVLREFQLKINKDNISMKYIMLMLSAGISVPVSLIND